MRELWARRIAILTGVLLLLLAVTFAHLQNPQAPPTADPCAQPARPDLLRPGPELNPQRVAAGRKVYEQANCALCHSIARAGSRRNPIDGVGAKLTPTELRDWSIGADHLQELMPAPAFRRKQEYRGLSDDALDALVTYLQSLRPECGLDGQPQVAPVAAPAA